MASRLKLNTWEWNSMYLRLRQQIKSHILLVSPLRIIQDVRRQIEPTAKWQADDGQPEKKTLRPTEGFSALSFLQTFSPCCWTIFQFRFWTLSESNISVIPPKSINRSCDFSKEWRGLNFFKRMSEPWLKMVAYQTLWAVVALLLLLVKGMVIVF